MSCNTANEILMKYQGVNVAAAFRDLPNVKKVYGYDGSMSFEDSIDDFVSRRSDPRLSDDEEQTRFRAIVDQYVDELRNDPEQINLKTYNGLFLYTDEED